MYPWLNPVRLTPGGGSDSYPRHTPDSTLTALATLHRHKTKNLKQILPEKELCGLSPNLHIHLYLRDFYILTIGLFILLQEYMWTDPGNI
jgi:hypothetical protein